MQDHHLRAVLTRRQTAGRAQQVEQLAGMDSGCAGVAVDDADEGSAVPRGVGRSTGSVVPWSGEAGGVGQG